MPRAPRLPALKADGASQTAAVAIALAQLRSAPAWAADVAAADLCMHKPPFGLRDSLGRVKGILWNVLPHRNASAGGSLGTVRDSQGNATAASAGSSASNGNDDSDGLIMSNNGRQLGSGAVRTPDNETEALEACLLLARVFRRVTGRPRPMMYGTCAVVGSSGGLTGSGQGPAIDAHDAVYRFNTAPLGEPYLADVGNRTTIWVASHVPWRSQARRLVARPKPLEAEGAALYCFNPWLGACHVDALGGKRLGVTSPLLISPALAAAMMQIQVALGGKSGGVLRPSTGLMGIGVALASCARVSLFGFGNDTDPVMQGHCNHYYDCRTNQTNYFAGRMGYHDWHGQWKVLAALIDIGAVRYVPPTGKPNTFHRPPPRAGQKASGGRAARRGGGGRSAATGIAAASGRRMNLTSLRPAGALRKGTKSGKPPAAV